MPANDALIASLLLGQRQKRDPLEIYQSFGKQQLAAGSSTAPLNSGNPLEGIARALQGGIGGLTQGYAIGKQNEEDAANTAALSKASTATTPEAIAAALSGAKGGDMNAVLGQIVQGRLDQLLTQQKAGAQLGPLMGGAAPSAPAAPAPLMQQGGGTAPPGGSIDTSTLAPQGVPQPGYSLANNPGNIRASGVPWDGKGAPQNGFETFATPQAGTNAQFKNFQAYAQANPNMTVAQAIAKWSPPNENNTQGVIQSIAEASGINPGMPLADVLKDPAMSAQLLDAQTRLEKGGLPQGYNADTFTQAAGGPAAAPGTPGPVAAPPPMQGAGPTPAPQSGPPSAISSPGGNQLRQRAQAAQQAGDNVMARQFAQEAVQEDTKWATTEAARRQTEADEERRHQRGLQDKKDNPTYTQEQNLAHTYATRLNNAIPQLEALLKDKDGNPTNENLPSWTEQQRANSSYFPEAMVSGKAKEFRRIVKDIMTSTLRRESGSAINPDEYTTEAQKFIPQPGDPPNVVANKISALKQAGRSIAEGAGRPIETYNFFGGSPAAGTGGAVAPAPGGKIPPPPANFRLIQ